MRQRLRRILRAWWYGVTLPAPPPLPPDISALAAAASTPTDTEIVDWIETTIRRDGGLLLHDGQRPDMTFIGLKPAPIGVAGGLRATLRQAMLADR